MRRYDIKVSAAILAAVALALLLSAAMPTAADEPKPETKAPQKRAEKDSGKKKDTVKKVPALDFKMKDIDGKEQDLKQYHGHVVLMINVASYCGLTPQYEQLQAVFKQYEERGFVILAFPANNFGAQEPDTNDIIKQFCTSKFAVTFPLFGKVSVKGDDICDLYKYLTDAKAEHKKGGEIEWNFAKFLVNRKGEVVERFHPRIKPDDKDVIAAIERLLDEEVPADSPLGKKLKEKEDEGDKSKPKPKPKTPRPKAESR